MIRPNYTNKNTVKFWASRVVGILALGSIIGFVGTSHISKPPITVLLELQNKDIIAVKAEVEAVSSKVTELETQLNTLIKPSNKK